MNPSINAHTKINRENKQKNEEDFHIFDFKKKEEEQLPNGGITH